MNRRKRSQTRCIGPSARHSLSRPAVEAMEARTLFSTLSVSASPASVGEAYGSASYLFNRTYPFPSGGPHYADFQMSGTARYNAPDADYNLGGHSEYDPVTGRGKVLLSPSGTATVTLTPINDTRYEGPETATLTVPTAPPGHTLGTSSATVTINDDDPQPTTVSVTAAGPDAVAHEGGGERGRYTFTLSGRTPSSPLTLQYRVRNPNPPEPGIANDNDYSLPGSAVAGTGEHAGYTLRSITFNPGVTVLTVDLTPAPDSRVEGDETVTAEVVPQAGSGTMYGSPGVVAGGAAAAITIKDPPGVDSVTWVGVDPGDGAHNLTEEPAETGNGFRLFPDKNTPGPDAPLHNKVTVKARLNRAVAAGEVVTVYIKVFDVDDPSAFADAVDADDVEVAGAKQYKGGDNRGTGIGPDSSSVLIPPEHNAAVLDITFANLNPGNNFRAFATTDQALFNEVQLDEAVDNGKSSVNPFRRGADPANKPDPKHASPTLTLWRKLHVELDSMAAPLNGEPFGEGIGVDDVHPGGALPKPNIGLAKANFEPAFIDVVDDLGAWDVNDDVGWDHNIEDAEEVAKMREKRDVVGNAGFWVANLIHAYEGPIVNDADPQPEEPRAGVTIPNLGHLIYFETCRDVSTEPNAVAPDLIRQRTVQHELAHNFSTMPLHGTRVGDDGPMSSGNNFYGTEAENKFTLEQLDALRDDDDLEY